MSYNGGWNEDKMKWMGLALVAALVLVVLANWAGVIHIGPPPAR
jgi:hypothetical protein